MKLKWPKKCSTCKKSYNKKYPSVCSNSFHCCRDCKWVDGELKEFCKWHDAMEEERDKSMKPIKKYLKLEEETYKEAKLLTRDELEVQYSCAITNWNIALDKIKELEKKLKK